MCKKVARKKFDCRFGPNTKFGPKCGPIWGPVLRPKFKVSIELHPRDWFIIAWTVRGLRGSGRRGGWRGLHAPRVWQRTRVWQRIRRVCRTRLVFFVDVLLCPSWTGRGSIASLFRRTSCVGGHARSQRLREVCTHDVR